jgi:hypothetical protein
MVNQEAEMKVTELIQKVVMAAKEKNRTVLPA